MKQELNTKRMLLLAKETISVECETLQALMKSLDASFTASLDIIGSALGRIVVTGIGKSALIGQKIVATFNSTGTPAIFMHAADAIHGDLGILQTGDVVLCLSKSGETEEIKKLIPVIQRLKHPLIAVVAQADSYLGRAATQTIVTPIAREADPNGLAPTASTMAQLAVGDALAACLISWKGFQPLDFAHLHPGGSLGKKLHLRCHRYMQPS